MARTLLQFDCCNCGQNADHMELHWASLTTGGLGASLERSVAMEYRVTQRVQRQEARHGPDGAELSSGYQMLIGRMASSSKQTQVLKR